MARIVVALGGNALLKRGEDMTATNQRKNARIAAEALAPLCEEHEVVITHGNGPQVGLLALQELAYQGEDFPLDVLGAETVGMIGYMIEQELENVAHRQSTLEPQHGAYRCRAEYYSTTLLRLNFAPQV